MIIDLTVGNVQKEKEHLRFEKMFQKEDLEDWQKQTYLNNKKLLTKILKL